MPWRPCHGSSRRLSRSSQQTWRPRRSRRPGQPKTVPQRAAGRRKAPWRARQRRREPQETCPPVSGPPCSWTRQTRLMRWTTWSLGRVLAAGRWGSPCRQERLPPRGLLRRACLASSGFRWVALALVLGASQEPHPQGHRIGRRRAALSLWTTPSWTTTFDDCPKQTVWNARRSRQAAASGVQQPRTCT